MFGWVLWYINNCRLFNVKSPLYIYINYIWFCLVGFYGISHYCRLFNAKSSLYIYIKYIWFCLVGFYGISTIVDYLMSNPLLYIYINYIWFFLVGFYDISTIVDYLMSNHFFIHKPVLFQRTQYSKRTQFISTWPVDRTLSSATTSSQSGPGSDSIKVVLRIPHSSSITGTSQSDCLVSYARHTLGESYPSTEIQPVYCTTPADRTWKSIKLLFGSSTV